MIIGSQLELELTAALDSGDLKLYYQPIITLNRGELIGFEALLHWQHPWLGLIVPGEFMPFAAAAGIIVPIEQWVLTQAYAQLSFWQSRFPQITLPKISVNLSGQQLAQPDFLARIRDLVAPHERVAHGLVLEITENAIIENVDIMSTCLRQLTQLGIQIDIDHFGTGYSSLQQLHQLPIRALKIDRTVVSQIGLDPTALKMSQSITSLAWSLNTEVIAVGIETRDQSHQLKVLGCNWGQGYFFSRPLDQHMATELIAELHPPPVTIVPSVSNQVAQWG
jgi:c-di-GMP phosphodiesterase